MKKLFWWSALAGFLGGLLSWIHQEVILRAYR
jgi:hypothetical protein